MTLNTPSQSEYSDKLSLYQELFKTIIPDACTKVGSTIYEWLIRPFSILSASTESAVEELGDSYTLASMQNSTATENAIADAVLSNYFITRNAGNKAEGVIRVYSSNSYTKVPDTTVFTANGVNMYPKKTIVGVYENIDNYTPTSTLGYVQALKVDDTYCFNVPVTTEDSTDDVVADGATVDTGGLIVGFVKAEMASALSGGGTAETDAEMVARAKATVASQMGGNQAILKMLEDSGYPIYGAFSAGPGDIEMTRDSMNSFHLQGGGCVDTYVKTSDYVQKGEVQVDLKIASGKYVLDVTDVLPAGCIWVSATPSDSTKSMTANIIFGSTDSSISADDARLSSKQSVVVEATVADYTDTTFSAIISYSYLPYIQELQDYVDRDDVKIAGLNLLIKSAVPVEMTISADCVLGEYTVDQIVPQIKTFINTQEIGTGVFNVSDLQVSLTKNVYGVSLRSPVLLQGVVTLKDGISRYFYTSNNGVLSAEAPSTAFSKRTTFFCISDANILINAVN